jgi:spore coat polysaccharide biosynthesis protein SpsF
MTKLVTVIQARMGSSRLPGKVLMPLAGKPLLKRIVERILNSSFYGTVVVAVTEEAKDDDIVMLCQKENLYYYRGSTNDLLDRHYKAGKMFDADAVVKIPSDCPLIDHNVINNVLRFYLDNEDKYDYVSNLHPATYPDGNDVEVMSMKSLEYAWKNAKRDFEREHTTPFLWENTGLFRIGNVEWEIGLDYSMTHRWTIDYKEDYEFIKAVYDELYHSNPKFTIEDILNLMEQKPFLKTINEKYLGVNWYRNHLNELKTITKEQTRTF